MKNFYINLNQIKSNPDGEPTVKRQSRLMLHRGNLRNLAMIFAVLMLSVANIGMAWGTEFTFSGAYDGTGNGSWNTTTSTTPIVTVDKSISNSSVQIYCVSGSSVSYPSLNGNTTYIKFSVPEGYRITNANVKWRSSANSQRIIAIFGQTVSEPSNAVVTATNGGYVISDVIANSGMTNCNDGHNFAISASHNARDVMFVRIMTYNATTYSSGNTKYASFQCKLQGSTDGTYTNIVGNANTAFLGQVVLTVEPVASGCDSYEFHYQHGRDWNTTPICFSQVGSTTSYLTDEMPLPYAEWYNVTWDGSGAKTQTRGFTGTTDNVPMPFYHKRDKKFGANPQEGNLGGGLGRFHVYSDSGDENKYVSFVPTGYTLNFGTGDWTHDSTLVFSPKTENWDETEWYTPITTLTNAAIGRKIFVGLKTELGYVWCSPYSEKVNVSGLRTKTGPSTWLDGGMSTSYANKTGKFRIYANSGDNNWYVTFVPHYKLTYNANGGSGAPAADYVSVEASPCQLTVSSTQPTREGYDFLGWNTSSSAASPDGAWDPGDTHAMTGNVTLYAVWDCITPDAPTASAITATDGCSAGATFSADIAGLPSYVTWYWQDAAGGTSTSNPASIDYTTDATAGSKTIYLRAKNTVCGSWSDAATKSATVRTAVTAAWNTAPADGTVGGSMTASVTTNYSAGLRFSSSDATVASVNETSGAISYLKAGTTTITATVTGADSYCSTASVNKSITVTAAAAYTITYNANGGSGLVPTDGNTYAADDVATVLGRNTLAKDGSMFIGWRTAASSGKWYAVGQKVTIVDANVTLYAQWRTISCPSSGTMYSLTMGNVGEASNITAGDSVSLETYATIVNGTATLGNKHASDATKAKIGNANPGKIILNGNDAMLKLEFGCTLAEGDTIKFIVADNNTNQISITTTNIYATSPATSNLGDNYHKYYVVPAESSLIGKNVIYAWRSSSSNSRNITALTITRPASCTEPTATFNNGAYTVGGSALNLSTLWTSNSSGAVTYTVKNANGTGATIAGTSFTATSAGTATVTATQAADATYCEKVMDATITVSAASGHTVTYNYNGATSGATPPSATGASVTLPNPKRTGYVLDGWYTTAGEKVGNGGATYPLTADITLYARWEEECDAGGVAKSTADVPATGYTTYQEVGGSNVVFTSAPSLGFKYKDADGNTINNSTTAVVRNNAYSCQIKSSSSNKGSIKTNSAYSNVDSISFYFAGSDKAGCKVAVWCSTDDFSADSTQLLSATAVASPNGNKEFTRKVIAISSGKKASALRFKFRFTADGSGKTCYMDSLKVYSSTSSGGTCYHVYYHGNGAESGFVSDTTSYSDGAKATVLSYNDSRYPLTKDSYDFQGWATTAEGSAAYSDGQKITIDGADVHLYAKWAPASTALVTWKMKTADNEAWATTTGTGTTDGTNISSIGTSHDEGDNKAKNSATAKTAMASGEVSSTAAPDKSARFTFTIGATKQVEISKFDCKVFNVNSGNRTYKAQISDAAGNVYNSTNTVAVSAEASLTDASFVFGSGKILRGAVTIRIYAWKTSGSPTDFRMGPDVKFYGAVQDYACATPSAPTISGVSEYVPGQTITLTASHDGENYDNLTTYTWYKGDTWGGKSQVQAAATGSAGYTFTKASCAAGDAGKYWCEVANGTCNAHNSEGYNIIVYPTYTITYNLDGGTNPVDPAPKASYTQFDEDYTLPIPTKADAIFAGWYEASDFSGVPAVILESGSVGDKQYWAKWGTAVTATWTITKVDDALYRGGSGYKVKAVIDQAAWDNAYKDQLELTATEGVTLKNIVKDEYTSGSDNGKTYVTADFDITTVVPANATQITFTLSVPADGTYAPAELTHDEALTDCSGGVVEVRFLSSEKNDAGEKFADMSTSSNTTQYVGSGLAKLIATGSSGLNDADKKIGYRADRLNVVFKLTATSALDVYFNAGSTGKSFTLYSFSSAKELSAIETSDYSSKTKITSVTAVGAAFASSGKSTTAGAATVSSGVVNISTAGGIKATYASLAAGYYVFIGSSDGYLYGFDVDGGAGGGGPVTPTLSWDPALNTDEDWKPANTRLEKETGDVDFTFVAGQDKNSLGAITYESSDPAVATVNAAGTVHIVGSEGDATITATLAASGCFEEATATYNIHVEDNCIDEQGTISTTDVGCGNIQMTVTGHTALDGVSYQWFKDGASLGSADGAQTATYTTSVAGEYYVVVDNTVAGYGHCAMASKNTITIKASELMNATKIVDQWYVKKDRRTPDVELVQTKGATGFTVKIGEETIWDEANSNTTGFAGCGFHMGENGIIYLNGTKDNGDAPAHDDGTWAAGDVTLKITANDGCGNSASELSIIIHKQAKTDRPSIAFVVDGTKDGAWDAVTSGHASGTDLYDYLNYNESTNPTGAFDLTERNIYHTTNEKDIREEYSQYDAILITDDPSTNTTPSGDYKTKGYVNAFGTMVDVRPILTMEAYVSALKNWSAKGIAGNPSSPNPRQYEIRLECKDHEIYKSGLPEAEDGTNVWDEVIGDDIFRHVILVDSTKGIYNGVAYNVETAGDKKPALQGFNGSAAGSLLGLGRILDGTLQAAIERQEEPAARLLVMGVNAKALRPTSALTPEGKIVIRNILTYLLKTNMEEVDDCSNYFTGATDDDWNKATNWSKGGLPSNEAKVRILAPCVVKNGNTFHVAQVDIATKGTSSKKTGSAANGSLTIEAGGALIVGGKIRRAEAPYFAANDLKPTTPEDLIINTDGSGQAALIFDNEEAETQATVNLYSLGRIVSSTYQFQYMAVPMEVVSVYPSFANEKHDGKMILTYVWKENGGWERRGYYEDLRAFECVGITTNSTSAMNYTMKGNLASTSQKEIALTNGSGAEFANNIIGNSWTAPIDIASLKTAIGNDNNVQKTIYIYVTGNDGDGGASSGTSGSAGQWLAIPIEGSGWSGWSGLKVIPAMQAFLIRVSAETSLELNYKEVVRKTATENLNEPLRAPRRAAADKDITMTTIHVADSKTYADLRLFEGKRFDEEFDNGWEAEYLPCDGRTATLYAETEAGQMAVAALPELEGTVLGFAPGKETEYTFTFLGGNEEYYLNDLKLKNSTLMSAENSYTFTFEEGDAANRFYISRTAINAPEVATGMENLDAAAPRVQKIIYNDKLYIIRGGRLYDATGKVVK